MNYYLAIDLGASGGRHILGFVEDGKLILKEVHRFSHTPIRKDESLTWDVEKIFSEITAGLEKSALWIKEGQAGSVLHSVGIDTWGVDYVLLDKDGKIIEPVYAYRDSRTEPFFETSTSETMPTIMSFKERYKSTGIANMPFNTIYQILADKQDGRLKNAEYMLQLPEFFSQRLTGNLLAKKYNEFTMASTTALVDAKQKVWAEEIFTKLDIPQKLFLPLREPPYDIGCLSFELQNKIQLNAKVTMIASHDTASAVATVKEGSIYISSGTWSLLGVTGDPILSDEARTAGYTNEGAHNGRIRFLKNIMGLWVIQSVRRDLEEEYSFAELEAMARDAEKTAPEDWTIDLNHSRFFSPVNMIAEIKDEYLKIGKKIPESVGELAFSVYTSLAKCYKNAIIDLEKITGINYPAISIIGGGSKDSYLNTLTAKYTGKTVFAGPTEATAIGNILLQMQAAGDPAVKNGFTDLVERSFDVTKFDP